MEFTDEMTLGEARALLRERVDEGHECPCCTQFAKVYKRKLNAGIAMALIVIYRAGGTDWVHKPSVLKGLGAAARDESIARYWGLIEEETERRLDGGRAGWWRITEHGARFIRRESRVLSHARIYDGRCLGLTGEPVDVVTCLGKKFSYAELMSA